VRRGRAASRRRRRGSCGSHRDRSAAGDPDVDVQPVLDCLAIRYLLEPDPSSVAVRINDAVLTDTEIFLANSEVALIVVSTLEAIRGRLDLVLQCRRPEPGQPIRVGANR
jgi:hypothetical protein